MPEASRAIGYGTVSGRQRRTYIALMTCVLCWGELLWDIFPDGPRLGGAIANVAYHAARLGDRPVLVSRVGDDDLGRRAMEQLAGAGVDVSRVQIDPERPTGTVRITLDNGEPFYALDDEAAWDRITWRDDLGSIVEQARVFCYGTLAQRTPLGSQALGQALSRAHAVKLCDLNVRAPFADMAVVAAAVEHADVVKLNSAENRLLQELFDVTDTIAWLLDEGNVQLVALTLGARGCTLATRAGRVDAPAVPRGEGGDTVGAGDAFSATLAHHLGTTPIGELDLDSLALEANAYASKVASLPGGMPA